MNPIPLPIPIDLLKIVVSFCDAHTTNNLITSLNISIALSDSIHWRNIFSYTFPNIKLDLIFNIDYSRKNYQYYLHIYSILKNAYTEANDRILKFYKTYNKFIIELTQIFTYNNNNNMNRRENLNEILIRVGDTNMFHSHAIDSDMNCHLWESPVYTIKISNFFKDIDPDLYLGLLDKKQVEVFIFISTKGEFIMKLYNDNTIELINSVTPMEVMMLLMRYYAN